MQTGAPNRTVVTFSNHHRLCASLNRLYWPRHKTLRSIGTQHVQCLQAEGIAHDTFMRDLKEVDRAILEGAGDGVPCSPANAIDLMPKGDAGGGSHQLG